MIRTFQPKTQSISQIKNLTKNCLKIIPNFITSELQSQIVEEVDQTFDKLVNNSYSKDHWDRNINHYREREFSHFENQKINTEVIQKIDETMIKFLNQVEISKLQENLGDKQNNNQKFFTPNQILPKTHCLDLHHQGQILPHVDSERFCGPALASLSLLSPSKLTLQKCQDNDETFSYNINGDSITVLLPAGSLYILTGEMRYNWTHAIENFENQRRISIIRRIRSTYFDDPSKLFNFGSIPG